MKISYRTHPILERLANKSLGVMPIGELDKPYFDVYLDRFVSIWKKYQPMFNDRIYILSQPFQDALISSYPKLVQLWRDMAKSNEEDYEVSGTFVVGNTVYMIYHYFKENHQNTGDSETFLYVFTKEGTPCMCCFTEGGGNGDDIFWVSKHYVKGDPMQWAKGKVASAVCIDLFIKHAQVETKFLPAGQRIKEVDCKYVNDTKLNITHLDSTWFTNLVKSDAFKVRGHFRLQPKKKEGEWTKELIWINDFEKHGYTRKAGILTTN